MNTDVVRRAGGLLRALFVDHDPAGGLRAGRELAVRTRHTLEEAGFGPVEPHRMLSLAAQAVLFDAEDGPRCIGCGCTDEQACPGGCMWVPGPLDGDLCSRCAGELAVLAAALQDAIRYRELPGTAGTDDSELTARYRELLESRYGIFLPADGEPASDPELPGRTGQEN